MNLGVFTEFVVQRECVVRTPSRSAGDFNARDGGKMEKITSPLSESRSQLMFWLPRKGLEIGADKKKKRLLFVTNFSVFLAVN